MQRSDTSNGGEAEIRDASFAIHSGSREELDEFDLVRGRKLQSPILGHHYQLDLPTSCIPAIVLDTSLLHIPVYAHLKIYDVKPVRLPEAPSILSVLQLQLSEDTVFSKSSSEISSTARLSEEDEMSASCSARIKFGNKKRRM